MSKFQVRLVSAAIWPVLATIPADGGDTEEHNFFVKFKMKSDDEYSALLQKGDSAMLREVVVGIGETEADVTEDKGTLDELLKLGYYRLPMFNAYNNFLLGIKAKN